MSATWWYWCLLAGVLCVALHTSVITALCNEQADGGCGEALSEIETAGTDAGTHHREKRFIGGIVAGAVGIAGMIMGRKDAEKMAKAQDAQMKFQLEQLCMAICTTEWSMWSTCTKRCGGGTMTRVRTKQTIGRCSTIKVDCPDKLKQTGRCNEGCENGGLPNSGTCECLDAYKGTCCERERVCEFQLRPKDGKMTSPSPPKYLAVATFECDEGFFLNGKSSIQCQKSERWTGSPPKCQKIKCAPPKDVNTLVRILNDKGQYYYGEEVIYACNDGYKLEGPSSRTCGKGNGTEGRWTSFNPTCEPVNCGDPGFPLNGEAKGTNFTFKSKVTFSCKTGFDLIGTKVMQCGSSGKWRGNYPRCEEVTCEVPFPPKHGGIMGTKKRYTFSNRATFECELGYHLNGSQVIECLENGKWNATEPKCQPAMCGNPGVPSHGVKDGSVYYYPNNITFSCHLGYLLKGAAEIACKNDGKWSNRKPTCEACPLGTYHEDTVCKPCPDNSMTTTNATNDRKNCICKKGYTGPAGGPCEEIHCGVLPDIANGNKSKCDDKMESVCTFSCDPGYIIMEGASIRTCQENGEWDGKAPRCGACPRNTYQHDAGSCLPCPQHSTTAGEASLLHNCTCIDGYNGTAGGPCEDIDECADGSGPCQDRCENLNGTYLCHCSIPGYGLDPKNRHLCIPEKQCQNLTVDDAPLNGGVVCHWYYEENSQQCALKCNDGYEFPSRINAYESCGITTGWKWTFQMEDPNSRLPPCFEEMFPGIRLEADSDYFVRKCDDLTPEEQEHVKQEFATKLTTLGVCKSRGTQTCYVKDIGIICGRTSRRRRNKRGVEEVEQSVEIPFNVTALEIGNGTLTEEDKQEICKFLKLPSNRCSKYAISAYKRFRKMALMHAKRTIENIYKDPKKLTQLKLQARGRVFEPQKATISDVIVGCDYGMKPVGDNCVACQPGTYHDPTRNDCIPCPVNTFQDSPRRRECRPCETGTYADTPGSEVCKQCRKGTYGKACAEKCGCLHGTCHPVNGKCYCSSGWEGAKCDLDIPGCRDGLCFGTVTCTDVPAPGMGFNCGACPQGMSGDGRVCQ